jgi:hypothetical protein
LPVELPRKNQIQRLRANQVVADLNHPAKNLVVMETEEITENNEEGNWSGRVDLNHRLHGPEPCALPS